MDFEAISIFILTSVAGAAITTIIGSLIKQYIERQSKKFLAIFDERVFCSKHYIPRDSWYRNRVQIELGMGKNVKTADSFSTAKLSLRNISGRQIKKAKIKFKVNNRSGEILWNHPTAEDFLERFSTDYTNSREVQFGIAYLDKNETVHIEFLLANHTYGAYEVKATSPEGSLEICYPKQYVTWEYVISLFLLSLVLWMVIFYFAAPISQ